MATRRPACASLGVALATTLSLMLTVATSGCSDAEAPTAVKAPAASEADAVQARTIVPSLLVTPSVTCSNGQTYITMCVNPDGNARTISVELTAARRLAAQGAWIGPCPGDSPINRCP